MPTDYLEKGYKSMETQMGEQKTLDVIEKLSKDLTNLVLDLRNLKPNDRGELDRRFAIAITDAEKLDAYITHYILGPIGNDLK